MQCNNQTTAAMKYNKWKCFTTDGQQTVETEPMTLADAATVIPRDILNINGNKWLGCMPATI